MKSSTVCRSWSTSMSAVSLPGGGSTSGRGDPRFAGELTGIGEDRGPGSSRVSSAWRWATSTIPPGEFLSRLLSLDHQKPRRFLAHRSTRRPSGSLRVGKTVTDGRSTRAHV